MTWLRPMGRWKSASASSRLTRISSVMVSSAIATVHILYGDGRANRTPEVRELASIWRWMAEVYPGTPRLTAGDHNLQPTDPAWQPLRDAGAIPSVTAGATTLSSHDGEYANLYDNFWYDPSELNVSGSGIVRYPELLGLSHQQAR
ncbi:exonuclease/endonuclease/phosphatase family protein [Modicisalibacter luteus]|uniref:Endonuclease/exonuclease/phosphatase domain-containing protein n=2 Tax=Modicisalibacter luteus TaxID=453962 RepID=A0ABV7LZN5_9GAMM|nr:hypothetical protein [Halomonas lutea]